MHEMYKISRQVLTQENLRKIILKYCSTSSKSKKPDSSKGFKKTFKKQYKSKSTQISTTNIVMEAFNAKNYNENDNVGDGNQSSDKINSNFKGCFPLAYSKFRHWEMTKGGSIYYENTQKEQGSEFTLVSYNILAQDLLDGHSYIYKNHKKDALSWAHRLSKLTDEILSLEPHIICIQEVQSDHLSALKHNLKSLNCECIYKKKTGDRTDGCAIFYNKDKFVLNEFKSVEYFQPSIEKLDRENVGIIAKLSTTNSSEDCFLVATTHLLYNPRRQDVRLAQIQVLLAELDHLSFKRFCKDNIPERFPIILTGDFNLKPYSAPYKLLTSGELEYSKLTRLTLEKPNNENSSNLVGKQFLPPRLGITDNCQHIDVIANNYTKNSRLHHSDNMNDIVENRTLDLVRLCPQLFASGYLNHGLNLKSAYHHCNRYEENYASTYQDEWITVDYIFYSKQFNYELETFNDSNLKLLSRYILPTVNQCIRMGMIPNYRLGSDHLALAVKFFLKSEK